MSTGLTKSAAYYQANKEAVNHNRRERELRAKIRIGDVTHQRPIGPFTPGLPSEARLQKNAARSFAACERRIRDRTSGFFLCGIT